MSSPLFSSQLENHVRPSLWNLPGGPRIHPLVQADSPVSTKKRKKCAQGHLFLLPPSLSPITAYISISDACNVLPPSITSQAAANELHAQHTIPIQPRACRNLHHARKRGSSGRKSRRRRPAPPLTHPHTWSFTVRACVRA
jgi:hypothetical protein